MATGDVIVRLIGDTKDLVSSFNDAGNKVGSIGRKLTTTLSPAAAAIGAGFALAFKEFDKGSDALRVGTGKTGKALAELERSAKNVSGTVVQGFGEMGQVMAELSSRTGLTGKPLENLTRQVLNLARITGTDAKASVEDITRLFGDWGVQTDKQTATLDQLFRVSQATGVPISRLSDLMVKFGAPLRQFNFGFTEAATTLAKFEREGVNTELVMGALRIALGKFSGKGEEVEQEMAQLEDKVAAARDKLEGLSEGVRSAALRLEDLRERAGDANERIGEMGEALREAQAGVAEAFEEAREKVRGYAEAVEQSADRLEGLRENVVDIRERIRDLNESLDEARTGVTEAFQEAEKRVQGYADAVERAGDKLADLQDNVAGAESKLGDLGRQLIEAKEALDEALGGASARDVREGELAIESARLAHRDAINDVEDAEKELQDAREEGDAEKIERAELRLSRARLALETSTLRIQDAEERLVEIRQKGTEQDERVRSARERVRRVTDDLADAESDLADAKEDLLAGQKDLTKAESEYNRVRAQGLDADEGVIAARKRVKEISEQLVDAENDLIDANEAVRDGQRDLAEATEEYNEIRTRGLEADEGVIAAHKRVEDATKNLSDAQEDLNDALRDVAEGHRDLASAQSDFSEGKQAVSDATDELERLASLKTDDLETALGDVMERIKNLDEAAANALAIEIFGRRAGPDMAAAIREGRFELEDLLDVVEGSSDTIEKATDDTEDWAEKFAKLKNRVLEATGPVGQFGVVIAGAIAGIGPLLEGVLHIFPALGPKIAGALAGVFSGSGILTAAGGAVGVLIAYLLSKLEDGFGAVVRTLITINPMSRLIGFFSSVLRNGWSGIVNDIVEVFGGIIPRFLSQTLPRVFSNAFDVIPRTFRAALNGVIGAWNSLNLSIGPYVIPSWVPFFGGSTFHIADLFPNIPYLAKGGIVTSPTLAMIGEGGPEAVIPLGSRTGVGGVVNNYFNINVPPTANKAEVGAAVIDAVKEYERRSGTSWRTT